MIPAHLIAEAMSTLRGLDLRWSGPITQHEMQFVEQYVIAKYPQYINGLVEGEMTQSDHLSKSSYPSPDNNDKQKTSPQTSNFGSSPSFSRSFSDLDQTRLQPSRLLEMLTKKSSPQGNFVSIPEIQARSRALRRFGLKEDEYVVLFVTNCKDALIMIGESYPFCKGSYYMTIIGEEDDKIREFAASKESKIVAAPETWLDLRIKGSQLSQYFRKKCKNIPKGLFSYPAVGSGPPPHHSMHWISEAHRNSWHVLLDATGMVFGQDHLPLTLHRPDFVLCTIENTHFQPSDITCLLVRRRSFDVLG